MNSVVSSLSIFKHFSQFNWTLYRRMNQEYTMYMYIGTGFSQVRPTMKSDLFYRRPFWLYVCKINIISATRTFLDFQYGKLGVPQKWIGKKNLDLQFVLLIPFLAYKMKIKMRNGLRKAVSLLIAVAWLLWCDLRVLKKPCLLREGCASNWSCFCYKKSLVYVNLILL